MDYVRLGPTLILQEILPNRIHQRGSLVLHHSGEELFYCQYFRLMEILLWYFAYGGLRFRLGSFGYLFCTADRLRGMEHIDRFGRQGGLQHRFGFRQQRSETLHTTDHQAWRSSLHLLDDGAQLGMSFVEVGDPT